MQKKLAVKRSYWSHVFGLDHSCLGALCGIWGLRPHMPLSLPLRVGGTRSTEYHLVSCVIIYMQHVPSTQSRIGHVHLRPQLIDNLGVRFLYETYIPGE